MSKENAPTAPCKLCRKTAKLQWSHIIPRWTYRRVIQGNPLGAHPAPVLVDGAVADLSQEQDAEYLLCSDCEQRIGKRETYVASIAAKNDGTFPAFEKTIPREQLDESDSRIGDASALDVETIAYFAMSVVWRASVSTMYSELSLGEKHETIFAQYLRGESKFPDRTALLMVELMRPDTIPSVDRMVNTPVGERNGPCHDYQFVVFGMAFWLLVGSVLPGQLAPASLVENKKVLLSDGRRLFASVQRAVKASTPGRRLMRLG